jgi:hypothetical protein
LWKNTNATEVTILKENGGEFPEPKENAEETETERFS